jgi:hypothetical protein
MDERNGIGRLRLFINRDQKEKGYNRIGNVMCSQLAIVMKEGETEEENTVKWVKLNCMNKAKCADHRNSRRLSYPLLSFTHSRGAFSCSISLTYLCLVLRELHARTNLDEIVEMSRGIGAARVS